MVSLLLTHPSLRESVAAALVLLIHCLPSFLPAKPSPSDYKEEAQMVIDALSSSSGEGSGKLAGQAWDRLAEFTDTIGR